MKNLMSRAHLLYLIVGLQAFGMTSLRCAAVTYELSGGRLGDSLLAYAHAKWLTFQYNIPLLYVPFEYSDQLVLHISEKRFNPTENIIRTSLSKNNMTIDVNKNYIYSVPYFSEDKTEFAINPHWIYYEVDWKNPVFKQQLQALIKPINNNFKLLDLPKDIITVALHVRRGGGYDEPFLDNPLEYRKGKSYTNLNFPLKFPPTSFYVEQLKKLSAMFKHAKMYVYVFTDDQNPQDVVDKIKKRLSLYDNMIFDYRPAGNAHNRNVLEDFFAITKFDCSIHPLSNFSLMAGKIADHKVEIFPVNFYRRKNEIIINEVKVICDKNIEAGLYRNISKIKRPGLSKK